MTTRLYSILSWCVEEDVLSAAERDAIIACAEVGYEGAPDHIAAAAARLMTDETRPAQHNHMEDLPANHGASQVLADEIGNEDPTEAEIADSNATPPEYFAVKTPKGEQYGMLLSRKNDTVYLRRVNADGTPYGGDNDEAYQTIVTHVSGLRPLTFALNVLKYKD